MTIGYIYKSLDKLGVFENCRAGKTVSNPDREPPWIIVDHSLDDAIIAHWPGQLWRAEVLDAFDPQDHTGNYTRCTSVKIIEELKTETLFGEHGSKIEKILQFASTLQLPIAQGLANASTEEAKRITSEGWHRWMAKSDIHDRNPDNNMSGVVAAGSGPRRSPIGNGLSLVHRCVWDSAKREVGDAAFEEDEDGIWLKPPWSDASYVLNNAAWAFGVPDLFNKVEIEVLLNG